MKSVSSKNILATSILLLLIVLLSGCGSSLEKGRKPSADWSRALPINDAASSLAGIAVDPRTGAVDIVWPSQDDSGDVALRHVKLDGAAEIVIDQEIARFPARVRALQLVSGQDSRTHLFWTAQAHNTKQWKLWHAQLDAQGEFLESPAQLSEDTSWVGDYTAVPDVDGGAALLWQDLDAGGFYFASVSSQGEVVQGPSALIQAGQTASLGLDSDGSVHLVWMEGNQLYYQSLAAVERVPVEGTRLMNIPIGTGDRLHWFRDRSFNPLDYLQVFCGRRFFFRLRP